MRLTELWYVCILHRQVIVRWQQTALNVLTPIARSDVQTAHICGLPWLVLTPVRRCGCRSIARHSAVPGARYPDALPETEMTAGTCGRRRCRGSRWLGGFVARLVDWERACRRCSDHCTGTSRRWNCTPETRLAPPALQHSTHVDTYCKPSNKRGVPNSGSNTRVVRVPAIDGISTRTLSAADTDNSLFLCLTK